MKFMRIAFVLLAAAFAAVSAQAQTCDNTVSTLTGKYVVDGEGNVSTLLGLLEVPVLTDGFLNFSVDTNNNPVVTATLFESVNRAADTTTTYTGTYQLNADCSYTVNLTNTTSNAARTLSIRADEIGRTTANIADSGVVLDTDASYIEKLSFKRSVDPAGGCTISNFTGEYDGTADEDDTPSFAGVYKVVYNSDGTFNLTETDSNGGAFSTTTKSGTFSVGSNCVATLVDNQQITSYIVLVFAPSSTTASASAAVKAQTNDDFYGDSYSYHPDHDGHHHSAHRYHW